MSFHRNLFRLAISNWFLAGQRSIFEKTFSWKLITKSNKNCCSSKKLSVCVLKTSYYFSEQSLVRRFEKNSILINVFWLRATKVPPIFSEKIWTFIVARLTGWTEKQWNFFKKVVFRLLSSNWFVQVQDNIKEHKFWTQKRGNWFCFCELKQSFINKFSQNCVLSVQWSFFGMKILGVFQDSERNLPRWCFQISYCTSLNAHLRRSFFGKTFPIEILWFQDALFWLVLSKVTWNSHFNRFFRKKWCATFEKKLIQEVAFRFVFARVLARICFGKDFSKFHVF